MKIATILELPTARIIFMVYEKGEVRYSELAKLMSSRGTLSLSLKELEGEGLIERRVVVSRPVQSYYSLTRRGKKIAAELRKVKEALSEG